ncbi:MAG TPA: PKD domain-containing protein [Cyclobacteriaceae bacterium]
MMPQYSKIKFKVVFLILFLTGAASVTAQNLEQNWFFGANNVGVQFQKPNYNATIVSRPLITPYGLGTGAVASDKLTGDLLFYTDGNTVYDRNHAVMTGGTGLLGTTSRNQVAAICKIPNVSSTSNSYYIFTNNAGTIQYSVVDMTLGLGFPAPAVGQVTSKNTSVPGLPAGLSEAMIVVSHANGEDFWLIVHDVAGNFYSVLINAATGFTVSAPATAGLIQNPANFCYHTSSNQIAVSPKEINKNIEIVTFDNATGTFTLAQTLPNSSLASLSASGQAIYDAEWSKDGDYLYASVFGNSPTYSAQVLQFDLVNSLTDPTLLPAPISTPAFTESYGLQMALDSNIYHLYKTGAVIKVGKILFTDSVASKVIYQPTPFSTVADFKSMQFPSFAPKDTTLVTLSFVPRDTCATNFTTFFPTVKPVADSLRWDFGDGSNATGWSPAHKYGSANTYTVKLVSFLNGDSTVFTRDVTIKQFSLSINLTSDTTACPSELPYPKTPGATGCTSGCFQLTAQVSGGTASEIQWYGPAGKMNQTLTLSPDSLGYYVLVVGDGTGCEAHAYSNIKEYGLQDQENAIWTFGDHAGIDFNPAVQPIPKSPVAINTALVDAPEGCADVCDENGQIIIYTDGVNLYDRDKNDITPTPNPPGLGGDTGSTQSSLIVKSPADATLIYIFTTQAIDNGLNEVRYSLFDATKFDATHPYGSVVISNQLLFSKATERLTSDGTWLLIHEFGSNAFLAYNLTNGIGNPVVTNIGSIHSFDNLEGGKGYMKFGPSPLLAVPINTPGVSNVIELFDFNTNTGTLSNYRVADTQVSTGDIYGIEFMSNKLVATIHNTPTSQIVEFFIDYKKKPKLLAPNISVNAEIGAIQTDPLQSTTYIAVNGASSLASISMGSDTTSTTGTTFTMKASPALLGGTSSNLGLPNVVNNHSNNFQTPTINVAGVCFGSKTVFTGTGTDVIDTLTWIFDDGSSEVRLSSDTTEVSRTFTTTGKHTVILKITNRCVGLVKQFSQDFIINPLPPDPTATTFLCDTNVTLDANPSNTSGLTYLWVTTDTTRKISVNRTGVFGVQLTSSAGCTRNGNLTVSPGLPSPFDLGRDSSLCAQTGATKVLTTNINIPNSNAWTKNGVAFGNTTQVTADLSTVGTWKYKVTFTSPLSGCKTSDSVTFIVKQPPVLSLPLTFTNPTTCNSTDGSISARIIAPSVSSDVFSYTLTPSGASGSIPYNALTLLSNTLGAGTYTATVTDNINNCSAPGVQTLTAPGSPVVTPSQVGTCDPLKLSFTATGPTTGTYRILNSATGAVVETGSFTSFPVTSTNAIPAGTYIVEVTTVTCTSSSSPFAIAPAAPLVISFDNSAICSGQLTANVTPASTITYDWSGSTAGSLPNMAINAATVTINNSSTPWTMVLKVTNGGANCPATGTFSALVDNITPDFTNTTCTDPIVLSATPKGSSYIYAWIINGGAPQAGTDNFNATVSANYQVTVQSFNGCPAKTSSAHAIDPTLLGPITVLLDNVSPCRGTPFDLTAVPSRTTATMSYTWTLNGSAIANSQDKNPLTGNTKTGTYAVTVFDGTCSDNATLALATLLDPTEGALKPSAFICPEGGEELTLDPDPDNTRGFIEFTWSVDGVEPSGNTNQTYVATKGGTYSVTLKNILNCISTDKTIVVEECDPDVNAPKAFKPSSSIAENTDFYVFPRYVDEQGFQVFIFNRWGEMVYQSNDLSFKWNGNFNNSGAALPPGTYSWVAKYKSKYRPQDGVKEKHGGVVLLR